MIDWHCHIIPAIDDGASDLEMSLAMARSLRTAGFDEIYCTPHLMKGCYEASSSEVRQAVAVLRTEIETAGIDLKLHPGREYCLDEYLMGYLLDDPIFIGGGRGVLVEIPLRITADMVRQLAYNLVRAGFVPVIAHPERCPLLEPPQRSPERGGMLGGLKRLIGLSSGDRRGYDLSEGSGNQLLDYLRDLGCLFQGNLGSFNGYYGRHVRSVAESLRSGGIYDRYGSDLHSPDQVDHVLKGPLLS